ncbi:MAG: hypothetical protein ACFFD7_15570 [Candidatus Thorarchaeota archaeon]
MNEFDDEVNRMLLGAFEHTPQSLREFYERQEKLKKKKEGGKKMENKPVCKLVGTDGNVFSVIGNVSRALKKAGLIEEMKEFQTRAFQSKSYDDVLQMCFEYVEVE